ncbi:unnamed protein product, partial [Brenthis ino]
MFSPFTWCFFNAADDGYESFSVVSEYFGRGLFNKLTVVTEAPETPTAAPAAAPAPAGPAPPPAPTYGPGAEAKLRLQEGQSKQVFVSNTSKQLAPKGTSVIPVPEGRMRVIEQQRYSSSLEAHLTRLEPETHKKSPFASPMVTRKEPKISAVINESKDSKNPFETYDESKNPFADDSHDTTNPFAEDDDYDKNLNPFS